MRVNFRWYFSLAASWVLSQERIIMAKGKSLTPAQMWDARLAGIAHPERVRLLRVDQVPLPEHPELRAMAEAMKLSAPNGLALRYGIYIRSDHWGRRSLLVHKLAHTAQYER